MQQQPPKINKWLLPISWIYGFIVFIRKMFFKVGILKQESFGIPIICVGNIAVGGTGKTPHIEYLVRLLKKNYKIAVLSRGYKRKTSGFVLADENTTFKEIGDEPFQIKHKFPDITVAVDEKRARGIKKLLRMENKPDVILLDDAFQHLYVKPSLSIVLSDYNRPIYNDKLLPAGRLREPMHNIDKASVVIITKCPEDLKPIDMRIISHDMNIYPYQTLLFSTIQYDNLISLFGKQERDRNFITNKKILLVTGIASPKTIVKEINNYTQQVEMLTYPDHHNFTTDDLAEIEQAYSKLNDSDAITIITEKDAARLIEYKEILSDQFKKSIYYLPIKATFVTEEDKEIFDKKINRHVRKNSRNSKLHKK